MAIATVRYMYIEHVGLLVPAVLFIGLACLNGMPKFMRQKREYLGQLMISI